MPKRGCIGGNGGGGGGSSSSSEKRPRPASPAAAAPQPAAPAHAPPPLPPPLPLVWEDLPSDAHLALKALRPYLLCLPLPAFPLALLGGHVGAASALALRRELAELYAAGTARELRLLGGEEVVVLLQDLTAHLRAAGGGRGALAFFSFLVQRHASPHVSQADLAVAYRAWLRAGGGSAAGSSSSGGGGGGDGFGLEQTIRALQAQGLLLKKPAPGVVLQDYYLGVPGGGALAQALQAGREELLGKLRRAPGRQLPREYVLAKVRLRSSPLPTIVHLREALGRGLVTVLHLSDGPTVRWSAA
jgi:hypothetical protein